MVTKLTDKIPEYYDEGSLPWPYDELPERIPIEMIQAPTIEQIPQFLRELEEHLGDIASLFMISNIPIRYDPSNRRVFIAPDWYISFNVDVAAIRQKISYDLWEAGKPPEFALEVASPSTYRRDLYQKPAIYAYIGIGEYWMFDPTGGELYGQALTGFRLVDGAYEPIEMTPNEHGLDSGYSDALRLRLCSMEKSRQSDLVAIQPSMVFYQDYYPAQLLFQNVETGLYLLNAPGHAARADQAEAERDAAQAHADQTQAQAAQAQARADQAEAERAAAQAQAAQAQARADQAEAERDAAQARAEAEVARLREQIRRIERG